MRRTLLALVVVAACGSSGEPAPRLAAAPPAVRDPCATPPTRVTIPRRTGVVPLGGDASLVAVGAGAVWSVVSTDGRRPTIVSVDLRSGVVRHHYPLRMSQETRIRVSDDAVWTADPQSGFVVRLDIASGERVARRPFGRRDVPRELAVGPGGVWVAASESPRLARLDPVTGAVRRRVRVPRTPEVADVALDGEDVWISTGDHGRVLRLDATGQVVARSADLGAETVDVEAADGTAWVTLGEAQALAQIGADGWILQRRVAAGGHVFAIALGFNSVWVTNFAQGLVRRIDARTGRVQGAPLRLGASPQGIAAGADAMWIANAGGCTLARVLP